MIPDHLIDKAAEASLGMPLSAMHHEDAEYARETARLALEAAAADIWDEGFEVGESNGYAIGRDIETSEDTTNPYRASETK